MASKDNDRIGPETSFDSPQFEFSDLDKQTRKRMIKDLTSNLIEFDPVKLSSLIEETFNPEMFNEESMTEKYLELYDETNLILDRLEDLQKANLKWRRRSWIWRVVSFVAGTAFGFVAHSI